MSLQSGVLCKGPSLVILDLFMQVSEKTTENSEWLSRQARPGFEPRTSHLPVLSGTIPPLPSSNGKVSGSISESVKFSYCWFKKLISLNSNSLERTFYKIE